MSITLVISDVHANQWALDAVLRHAEQFKFDEIWFLGDLWGYGPSPYEVWEKLFTQLDRPMVALVGNHDWAICGIPSGPIRPDARAVIEEHRSFLGRRKSVINSICRLPVMCSPRPGVYLAHGEILPVISKSIASYLRFPTDPPERIAANFSDALQESGDTGIVSIYHKEGILPSRLFAVGQIHEQKLWEWQSDDGGIGRWQEKQGQEFSLTNLYEHPIGFNPGSVGFPRADSGCPGYAVIDWNTNMLFFQRVKYDTKKLRQKMEYPPYQTLINDSRFFVEPHC